MSAAKAVEVSLMAIEIEIELVGKWTHRAIHFSCKKLVIKCVLQVKLMIKKNETYRMLCLAAGFQRDL